MQSRAGQNYAKKLKVEKLFQNRRSFLQLNTFSKSKTIRLHQNARTCWRKREFQRSTGTLLLKHFSDVLDSPNQHFEKETTYHIDQKLKADAVVFNFSLFELGKKG